MREVKVSHSCHHRQRVRKGLRLGNLEAPGVKELDRENEGWGVAEAGDEWEASGTALPALPDRQISEGGKVRKLD